MELNTINHAARNTVTLSEYKSVKDKGLPPGSVRLTKKEVKCHHKSGNMAAVEVLAFRHVYRVDQDDPNRILWVMDHLGGKKKPSMFCLDENVKIF